MTDNIIRIRCDDCLFIINTKTINKFPDTIFYKSFINDEKHDLIHKENNSLYIDLKPEYLKIIVEYMKGYEIDTFLFKNKSLMNDFLRVGLKIPDIMEEEKQQINVQDPINLDIMQEDENISSSFDEVTDSSQEITDECKSPIEIIMENNLIGQSEPNINDFKDYMEKMINSSTNDNIRIVRPKKERIKFEN